MSELEKWLDNLGLGAYRRVFERHEVDIHALPSLSDDDLRELHIPLGPRKKLLSAISALDSPRASTWNVQSDNPATVSSPLAERRPLTILICDLVASTEYADIMDPEDFRDLIQEYMDTCSAAIKRYDGLVANHIGDAVTAYFGYPQAHEDDSERALRVAFHMLDTVGDMKVGSSPVQVRIGVASGLVVVGQFAGAPAGVSTMAFGYVAHLAARLQALATPQTILTDDRTYKTTSGTFEFSDRKKHKLKGFANLMQVWEVKSIKTTESRFAEKHSVSTLIGRDREIDLLLDCWNNTVDDRRIRVIDLEGEPGIGKSRIVHELLHKISSTPHMQLFYQCSPYFSSTALYPILNAIERQAGFHKEDSVEVRLKKLEHVLSSSNAPVDTTLPVFAWLLAISTEGQHKLPDISPQRQKEITQKTFIDWVVNLAEIHPVLLVVEDAQWIDPTSRELLDGLIERAQALPILVVVTSRPDSSWSWDSGTPVTSLTLGRLSRNQIAALIKSHSSNTEISDQAVSYIEEKSVGIPLFAEELTKAAIETGLDTVEILDWPLETTPAVEIPSSVQSSLLARLDRLGSVKEIAQIAATIGGDFDADLLKKISKRPAVAIAKALEQLTESDLISCNNKSARPTYVFKHKLLQDAARGTLLRSHRQTLHDQIAQTLLEAYPEVSVAHPELLAQHFTEANKLDQAVDYWLLAGRRAARTWAKQEAVKLMEKGIEVLQKLPVNQARRRKELDIQLERGDAASAAFGHATAESHEAYQRAWELSEQLNDTPATIRALDGLSGIRFNSASFNTARDASDRLINLGEVSGNLSALVRGLQGTGMCLFAQGELCSARTYLERALTFEDQADEVGADFPSMTTMYLASTLHILGYHQRAVDLYLRAQAIARDQTVYNLAASLGNGCHLYGFRDEFESINKLTDELIPLAQENGLNMWLNLGTFFRGWALANSEQTEKGTALMQDTINHIGGDELEMSYFLGLMARAYWRSGRIEEAEGALDQAVAQAEKTGEHFYTAELIRLNGELLLDTKKNLLAAEQCFRDAIAFSNNQEARSWELRAANSLARLLTMQGLREEAQQVLTPVQKWFDRV